MREVAGASAEVANEDDFGVHCAKWPRDDWKLHAAASGSNSNSTDSKPARTKAARRRLSAKASSSGFSAPTKRTGQPTVAWRMAKSELFFGMLTKVGKDAGDELFEQIGAPEDLRTR